jgi:haloacetate dehalogenase
LLLHGFPQTHYCWHRVAPALAERATVVVCDLKGYGESRGAPGGPLGEGYSNRERAGELVELMAQLGFDRFSVVGHDRGGRVAYRMALDHPDVVVRLGVLNIVPTVVQFERMAGNAAIEYYPFTFLAQPAPFAERVVSASAEYFLSHTLDSFAGRPEALSEQARDRYRRAFTPETIAGICADYRASFHLDREHESADRAAGQRIVAPALVVTGEDETQLADAPDIWRAWADDLSATRVPGGHFLPEESPEQLGDALAAFLAA